MPKYLINDEENVQLRIQKNRYNDCCINKNVCVSLSIILCIILLIGGITCITIYAQYNEDGSF